MTNPKRISVGPVGEHIALARWGEDGSGKPPALLLHGTGFVAEVWDEVARELASRYTVYALDSTCVCGMDRVLAPGLHPAWLCPSEGRPGTTALHA